jgi:hypothetical protein
MIKLINWVQLSTSLTIKSFANHTQIAKEAKIIIYKLPFKNVLQNNTTALLQNKDLFLN